MHYVVIAAGEGSRLVQEGVLQPKPLIPLKGRPMVGRLLDIFCNLRPESISIIVNERMRDVEEYVRSWQLDHPNVSLRLLVKSTPSSMHSLAALCDEIVPSGKFVCTTVDTIFRESEFSDYIDNFEKCEDFLFGVTSFVDDEKPLWVHTEKGGVICSFSDQGPAPFVSGGIYGMDRDRILPVLHQCLAAGQSRMRNFQRALLTADIQVRAYVFDKIMDIDHKSDIQKAEQWLA